jgi:hypothetical protein
MGILYTVTAAFWIVTSCSLVVVINVSEELITSTFRVKSARIKMRVFT